jgi:3'-5' exoribonuclease
MGKRFVAELSEGEAVTSFFLIRQLQLRQRRTGEPYLTLTLADRTGEVAAVLWEAAAASDVAAGDFVKAQGLLGSYHDEPQLILQRLRKAAPDEIALEDYLPRSERDPGELWTALREAMDSLREPALHRLFTDLCADSVFVEAFGEAPAATHIHHAVLGGLLEHTASVVGLCRLLAEYYPVLDRDLLLAAAFLHDVGKIRELSWEPDFDYTDAGRLLGHITLGALFVEERIRGVPDFPAALATRLLHCILSHHGELAWGSPKRPKTLEAFALHTAENLDGKINALVAFGRQHPDPRRPGWTQYNRSLDRYLYLGRPEATPDVGPTIAP